MVKGIIRRIDDLGRVCIPREMRKNLNIVEGDILDISVSDGVICLEPCRVHCVYCGAREDETFIKNRGILLCGACAEDIVDEVAAAKESSV